MTTQHTPGPWTFEGDHTHRSFNIRQFGHLIGTSDQAKHICTINNLPPQLLANRDPGIAEANARLIAAAPELLAALKELQEKFVEVSERYRGASWCYGAEAISNARAAIAKAEGW